MTMCRKFICSALTLASFGALNSSPAVASEFARFPIRRNANQICIENVTVEQGVVKRDLRDSFGSYTSVQRQEAKLGVNFNVPTCPNQYHTEGFVKVRYNNGSAFLERSYSIGRQDEGKTRTAYWQAVGYYGSPNRGRVYADAAVKCIFHGNKDSAIPNPFGL